MLEHRVKREPQPEPEPEHEPEPEPESGLLSSADKENGETRPRA